TNDALAGMREPPARARDRRSPRRLPLYGRWSVLPEPEADPGRRAEAWAERLLRAYGVVAREMAVSAEAPVPWPHLLDALTTMEAQGTVRRGYFVRGLSGIQFAVPAAVERLRRRPSRDLRVVAAADPANPYGRILPLPADRLARVNRVPGSWLVLAGGVPVLGVEGRGRRLVPLSSDRLEEALGALAGEARRFPGGRIAVERWGDAQVTESEGARVLARAGFSPGPRRMTYRAPVR
ncbi:MAG: Lhr family helicase, partial [Acidimicrobiia bacterium]